MKAVISFSPGDYLEENFPSLKTVLPKIKQPFLVTSSNDEASELKALLSNVEQSNLHLQFIPDESEGTENLSLFLNISQWMRLKLLIDLSSVIWSNRNCILASYCRIKKELQKIIILLD